MRIAMRVQISGTRNGVDWPRPGETLDVDDAEAAHLCAAGLAVPVPVDDVETAVTPAAEKRTAPPTRTARQRAPRR